MRLLTWLSPAFPTGAFAYSHGLEWAVDAGDIRDGDSLREWLTDVLEHGSGRSDAILLRHARRGDPVEVAALARAATPSAERRDEALYQGRAFSAAVGAWVPSLPDDLPYAVAVAAAMAGQGIDEDTLAAAYLQAFTTNLISAAVRLVPLGQTTGLQVLAELEGTILKVAEETKAASLDDVGGCAFRSDIAAMQHETQYTRLFRS